MENFFNSLVKITSVYKEIPEFHTTDEFAGIKAITYDGVKIGDKKTKVFAYIGFPEGCSKDKKVPAVVLVHGGGGKAFHCWVKMWNDRGYAAIAMSTTGDFPTVVNAGRDESESVPSWQHGLYGLFEQEGYTSAPANDEMQNSEKLLEEQWMYHAVSQVILANNIIRADERVDTDKVGIVGVSWGGVITSITIGYDNRFAFAVPIYGSGYLMENKTKSTLGDDFRSGKNPELWLAEKRFCNVDMPVLWECMNDDSAFSVNSNSASYTDTEKNNADTRISIIDSWGHSHQSGWSRKEGYLFADSVCKSGKRLPALRGEGKILKIENPDSVEIVSAKLCYLTKEICYCVKHHTGIVLMDEQWKKIDLNFDERTVEVILPQEVKSYYVELVSEIDGEEYVSCSSYVEIK